MLASILSETLKPAALVLMSSTPTPDALGSGVRVFEWMSRLLPDKYAAWLTGLGHYPARWLDPMTPEQLTAFRNMVENAPIEVVRQGSRMIMEWKTPPRIPCPVYHIHGRGDLLIPIARLTPTHIVDNARHLLNLTHPSELRPFINDVIGCAATTE